MSTVTVNIMDAITPDQQQSIQLIALPTPKEFITLHEWMLSQLKLKDVVSSEYSAEQNCKSVLKHIEHFQWEADTKEDAGDAEMSEVESVAPVVRYPSPTESSSSTSSDSQTSAMESTPGSPVVKTSAQFDKRRLKLHKQSKIFCKPCGRNFGTKGSYSQHCKAYHSGPLDHRCDHCGKRFLTEAKMKAHQLHHTMKEKPFKCKQCPSQFIYGHDLKRHEIKNHDREDGFVCKVCGLKCSRPDILALHEIKHRRKEGE